MEKKEKKKKSRSISKKSRESFSKKSRSISKISRERDPDHPAMISASEKKEVKGESVTCLGDFSKSILCIRGQCRSNLILQVGDSRSFSQGLLAIVQKKSNSRRRGGSARS